VEPTRGARVVGEQHRRGRGCLRRAQPKTHSISISIGNSNSNSISISIISSSSSSSIRRGVAGDAGEAAGRGDAREDGGAALSRAHGGAFRGDGAVLTEGDRR
jgi:hypothetical protein